MKASKSFLDALPGLAIVAADGRVTHVGRAGWEWLGAEDAEGAQRAAEAALEGGVATLDASRGVVRVRGPSGAGVWVEARVFRADVDGDAALVVLAPPPPPSCALSLDERVAAQAGHELRTRLASLLGQTEALEDGVYGPLEPRQRASLRVLAADGQAVMDHLRDLLDFGQVGGGRLALSLVPCGADELAASVVGQLREEARRRGVFLVGVSPQGPVRVLAEAGRLRQVLLSLASHALAATPRGGSVALRVESAGRAVRFEVRDGGSSLDEAARRALLLPYADVRDLAASSSALHGLSLALAARLVEAQRAGAGGAPLRVESPPSGGVRFTFALAAAAEASPGAERSTPGVSLGSEPSETTRSPGPGQGSTSPSPAPPTPAPPVQATPLPPLAASGGSVWPATPAPAEDAATLLVAEDHELNLQSLCEYLRFLGHRVFPARDGHEAVALARSLAPDVVLMDIQMPRLDGLAATAEIRRDADPRVRGAVIVALTALAMPGDRDRCVEAGTDHYMAKPVRLKELGARLSGWIEQARRRRG